MTEQETKAVAPKAQAEALKAEEAQAPKPQTAKDVLQNLKDKKSESKEVASEKQASDVFSALKKAMKEGLPKDTSGPSIQSIADKFHTINEQKRERQIQNFERAKQTLEGAIASGDKPLIRAALAQVFDLAPEDWEVQHACPSLSAREQRAAHGFDYLVNEALLILSDGSEANRTQILETLETEFLGPLYGYAEFVRENPEYDRISNREGNEKILLGQHLLYDETMSTPEKQLFEYLRKQRRSV